jgi:transcriptional regulator with XRE-family HTH domain
MLDMKQLGQRIRHARERAGLSQEEFAALIARDQRAVSQYENGVRKIAVTDLSRFAEALGMPVAYFYEDLPPADELDQVLLHEFHQLPSPELKALVIEMVRLFTRALHLPFGSQ